jgi:hypothetical protein
MRRAAEREGEPVIKLKAYRREQVQRLQKAVNIAEIAYRCVMRDAQAYEALKERFGIADGVRRTKADVLTPQGRDFVLAFDPQTKSPMIGVADASSLTVEDISEGLTAIKDTWEQCGNQYDNLN